MKTVSKTSGTSYDGTSSVRRECPMITSFPTFSGRVKTASLSTYMRISSPSTHDITVVLFKTFGSSSNWENRTNYMYQYPPNSDDYLTSSTMGTICQNILASKSISISISSTGNQAISLDFIESDITDYGKTGENWSGTVYIGIYKSSYTTDLHWGEATTSTLSANYNNGIVKYGVNGVWQDCEVYYGVNGSWQRVQPSYATNSEYKEIGV